jgi:hypothetical protein
LHLSFSKIRTFKCFPTGDNSDLSQFSKQIET